MAFLAKHQSARSNQLLALGDDNSRRADSNKVNRSEINRVLVLDGVFHLEHFQNDNHSNNKDNDNSQHPEMESALARPSSRVKADLQASSDQHRTQKEKDEGHRITEDPHDPNDTIESLREERDQLLEDLEVLASHLEHVEAQQLVLQQEKQQLRQWADESNASTALLHKENDTLKLENDAIRQQNALLNERVALLQQQVRIASETQEELMITLQTHQREREICSRQLVLAQEAVTHAKATYAANESLVGELQQQLHDLQLELDQSKRQQEAKVVDLQRVDESMLIESLRHDLAQMEFEYRTVLLDKQHLLERITKMEKSQLQSLAQQLSTASSSSAGLPPIHSDANPDSSELRHNQAWVTSDRISSTGTKKTTSGSKDKSRVSSQNSEADFSNIMELPNAIHHNSDTSLQHPCDDAQEDKEDVVAFKLVPKSYRSEPNRKKPVPTSSRGILPQW